MDCECDLAKMDGQKKKVQEKAEEKLEVLVGVSGKTRSWVGSNPADASGRKTYISYWNDTEKISMAPAQG